MEIVNYSAKAIAVIGEDTRAAAKDLKAIGGRSNPRLSCGAGWIFPASKREQVAAYIDGGTIEQAAKPATPKAKAANDGAQYKAVYMAEMAKVWAGDERMMKFAAGQFSGAVLLSGGRLLVYEKPKITTDFCFGYYLSGSDSSSYDEANRLAHHAGESEEYFLNANLADLGSEIDDLKNSDGKHVFLHRVCYCGQKSPLNLWRYTVSRGPLSWFDKSETQDVKGLTRYVNSCHPGAFFYDLVELSDDDRKAILAGLQVEREKFGKRLRAYLKRYGLSKVNTWSYWRDE